MTESQHTWLPNLVGGVSLWKLAGDLNEPQLFDGRLLTPEVEGSESLPSAVRWDVAGLEPLDEARARDPQGCAAAEADFRACLARASAAMASEDSGYARYREGLTMPALDAGGAPNYFYDAKTRRLAVINWGAVSRAFGAKSEFVLGHDAWAALFAAGNGIGAPAAKPAPGAGPTTPAPNALAQAPADVPAADAAKDEKPKDEKPKAAFPWRIVAIAVAFLALLILALYLLRACPGMNDADTTADAAADGGRDATADATADAGDAASADAAHDGASDASAQDAGRDATVDAADAGDAGDAGDASASLDDDDDDTEDTDDIGTTTSSGGSVHHTTSGSSSSGTTTSGGTSGGVVHGKVTVGTGIGAGSKAGPKRVHVNASAVDWRITSGKEKMARTVSRGTQFTVWLKPNQTFDGLRVEWQDAAGRWHPH